MLWNVLYFVVTTILTIALAPRPPTPKAAGISDFTLPTADQGRNIPVAFGTNNHTGANCVWYGDLVTTQIRKHSLFSSQVTGYQYFMGFHLVLGHGPFDTVTKVYWDEKLAWIGTVSTSTTFCMSNLDLFGGTDGGQGGVQGCFDVVMGTDAEPVNSYLTTLLGNVPAFRGVTSLIWKRGTLTGLYTMSDFSQQVLTAAGIGYIGSTPYVKAIAIEACRITQGWNIPGDCWYPTKATITHIQTYSSPPSWSPTFNGGVFGAGITPTSTTMDYDVTDANFNIQTAGFIFIGSEWIQVTSVQTGSDGHGGTTQTGVMNITRGLFGTTPGTYAINTLYNFYLANVSATPAMNAAHIIYQCLTDPRWGMGLSVAQIDDTAFRAAADTFFTENMGLCMQWVNATTVEDFLKIVLNHCAANLVMDNFTGLYQLIPIRGGYTISTLPSFDQSDIAEMTEYATQGWSDETNEVTLVYTDPSTAKDTAIVGQDIANIDIQGKIVPQTVNLQGIRDHLLAADVLGRELSSRCTPLVKVKFTINRDAWGTSSGGLFRLTWPPRNAVDLVMRISEVGKGTISDNKITVTAVQDIYSLGLYNYQLSTSIPPTAGLTAAQRTANAAPLPDNGGTVISGTLTSPPGSPTDGDRYLVPGSGATGVWAGHANQVAIYNAPDQSWDFISIPQGALVFDQASSRYLSTNAAGNVVDTGLGSSISASEVSFDDSIAHFPGVTNVQQAIDALVESAGSTSVVNCMTFTNSLFYGEVFEDPAHLFDSPDGITWTARTNLDQTAIVQMKFSSSHNYGIAGNQLNKSTTSDPYGAWSATNVNNFPLRNVISGVEWQNFKLLNGTWYAWNDGSIIVKSSDFITWVETGAPLVGLPGYANDPNANRFLIKDIFYDSSASYFILFGQHAVDTGTTNPEMIPSEVFASKPLVFSSTDMITFTQLAELTPHPTVLLDDTQFVKVVYTGSVYAALLEGNLSAALYYTSSNSGVTWTQHTASSTPTIDPRQPQYATDLIWDGAKYVMTWYGLSATSTDFTNWTFSNPLTAGLSTLTTYVLYTSGAGTTVASAFDSGIWSSTDGLNWTRGSDQPKALASQISVVTTGTDITATDAQSAITLLGSAWSIIRNQVFGS